MTFFRDHEGMEVLSYDTGGAHDHAAFDQFLERLYSRTNPVRFLGSLLEGKRMVWLDPNPRSTTRGIELLRTAAHLAEAGFDLQEVTDVAGAIAAMQTRAADIVITHWGHSDNGDSNALRLLQQMRQNDLVAPVIVFASGDYADENKRAALRAGALAYSYRWSSLFRRLRDVFDDGTRTG